MAATVNAWSKPGAWALDSEENEAELQQQQLVAAAAAAEVPPSDFPSLASAVSTKTKKKKPQPLSMQEFHNYASAKQVQSPELISLPTGPRERTAEELDRSRLGGGFRSYGSSYDRPDRDDSRRQGSRDFAPSRADETDDWGASKKFSQGNGFERRDRGDRAGAGFFSDSQSRADGSDNWGANKAFVPSDGGRRGFERRGGFESNGGGADSDVWTRKKEDESRKFGSDSEGWGRKREERSVNTERPRLNLKPRTIPLGEGQMNGNGSPGKPKGSNPFGEARPREEVLREKGQDWKEIEQKLEAMKMKDVGKKSFGSSNGRTSPDDITEKSWRKSEENDSSSEKPDGRGEEEYRDGECNEDAEPLREEK